MQGKILQYIGKGRTAKHCGLWVGGWGCVDRAQTGAEERENTADSEGQMEG